MQDVEQTLMTSCKVINFIGENRIFSDKKQHIIALPLKLCSPSASQSQDSWLYYSFTT